MGSAAQGPGLANGMLTLIGTVQELSRMKSEILMSSCILPWRPPALVLRLSMMTWVPSSRFFVLNMIQRLVEKQKGLSEIGLQALSMLKLDNCWLQVPSAHLYSSQMWAFCMTQAGSMVTGTQTRGLPPPLAGAAASSSSQPPKSSSGPSWTSSVEQKALNVSGQPL